MKTVARRELVQRLRRLGFDGPFSGGKHDFMTRGRLKLRIPNVHGAGDVSQALLREILRQGGISWEEWKAIP